MPPRVDIAGQRFGRIVAIEPTERRASGVVWRCRCDCGGDVFATPSTLRRGNTTQCDPCARRARITPVEDRFWAQVDKNGPTQPHMATCCWVWMGHRLPSGYGQFAVRGSHHRDGPKSVLAHRFALELRLGRELRDDEQSRHDCDFKPCCRPDHLQPGTGIENMADARERGRVATGERHGSARLSDEQVDEIRSRRQRGEPLRSIAAAFGVRESTVSRIANNVRRAR